MKNVWSVDTGGCEVLAIVESPEPGLQQLAVFVGAHGAGGHRDDAGMRNLAGALRGAGIGVIRFNFPYRERGCTRPDPMPVLQQTVAAVAQRARTETASPLILGGRSMGGRAASMLVAGGFACDGLLLLAYPLPPAGRTDSLRDAHLTKIDVPVLSASTARATHCANAI